MSSVGYSNLDSTAAIARVLVRSTECRTDQFPYVKDISELFFNLREKGYRFRDFGLRRIPDGYYSEDVENFVGQLLSMGYATQRSPIRLEAEGIKFCKDIFEPETAEHTAEVKKLEKALDELIAKQAMHA